jgi:polyisoprenoid-binding protein YceI
MNFRSSILSVTSLLICASNILAQDYTVIPKKSTVQWTGTKVTGSHTGAIGIKDGSIQFEDGRMLSVSITIDMTSIVNTDLSGGSKNKLENHLKSDDFFAVNDNPIASFTSSDISEVEEGYQISGELMIKGKLSTVSFIGTTQSKGGSLHAQGTLEFDRSLHDVRYGSDSFFDNLGDKVIDDMVELKFSIMADKTQE